MKEKGKERREMGKMGMTNPPNWAGREIIPFIAALHSFDCSTGPDVQCGPNK